MKETALLPDAKQHATNIARALRERGYQAYFAGGCVRDTILAREPADYDVATDATPRQVMQIFPRTFAVGAQFGVVLVPDDRASDAPDRPGEGRKGAVEVATFAPMSATPMAAIPTRYALLRAPKKTCSAAISPSTACCSIP